MEDLSCQLHLQRRGSIDPLMNSGGSSCTSSCSTSWLTQVPQPEGSLLPTLLVLSPDLGRCEISVLDIAAWSSTAPWRSYPLHETASDTCSASINGPSGSAEAAAPALGRAGSFQPNGPVAAAAAFHTSTASYNAACGIPELPAVPSPLADLSLPPPPQCNVDRVRQSPARATARPAIRSVAVARVRVARSAGSDSPAGSSSSGSHSGMTVCRSCLRPSRTWTSDAAAATASGMPGDGETMRPPKTVRWLDHVALQVVAEVQSAASSVFDPLGAFAGPSGNAHPTTGPARCPEAADSAPLVLANAEEGDGGDAAAPESPSSKDKSSPTDLPVRHSSPCMKCLDARKTFVAAELAGDAPANDQMADGAAELGPESGPAQSGQGFGEAVGVMTAHSPLPRELCRFLSPQMLRALEHSQPISDVRTFTRSENLEPSIVHVQLPYAMADGGGADPMLQQLTRRVPMDWLSSVCYDDDHGACLSSCADERSDFHRNGTISVLDSTVSEYGAGVADASRKGHSAGCSKQQEESPHDPSQQQTLVEEGQQVMRATGPSSAMCVAAAVSVAAAAAAGGGGGGSGTSASLCGTGLTASTGVCTPHSHCYASTASFACLGGNGNSSSSTFLLSGNSNAPDILDRKRSCGTGEATSAYASRGVRPTMWLRRLAASSPDAGASAGGAASRAPSVAAQGSAFTLAQEPRAAAAEAPSKVAPGAVPGNLPSTGSARDLEARTPVRGGTSVEDERPEQGDPDPARSPHPQSPAPPRSAALKDAAVKASAGERARDVRLLTSAGFRQASQVPSVGMSGGCGVGCGVAAGRVGKCGRRGVVPAVGCDEEGGAGRAEVKAASSGPLRGLAAAMVRSASRLATCTAVVALPE